MSDDRHTNLELWPYLSLAPFLRAYDASTGALGPELAIPTGSPPELTDVTGLALDAERVGSELHVHLALLLHVNSQATPYTEVRLVTSHDGGATFLPAPTVALSLQAQPFQIYVQAEAGVVHVAWSDQRDGAQQVYYQRSSDGGQTFDFAAEKQLTSGTTKSNFDFDAQGTTLAFAVEEYTPKFAFVDVRAAVSTDGGTVFGSLESVPHADPWVDVPSAPSVAVTSEGAVLLAWHDLRHGSPHVYASRTSDGGATWTDDLLLSPDGARYPELVAAGAGRKRVVAAWRWGQPIACVSSDAGATWGAPFELSADVMYAFGKPRLAFNDRYQNLIAGWSANDKPYPIFAGGFRPQTLAPSGFTPGTTEIGAVFERFDDGSPLAFFLVSTAPGDLPLPFGDLRNTGLGLTPLFLTSVGLAAGPFAAGLDAAGSGALAPLPAVLPAPLTVYALGLSFDPATLSFGDVSDVVRIDL